MKKLLTTMFVALLMVGCSEERDYNKIADVYAPSHSTDWHDPKIRNKMAAEVDLDDPEIRNKIAAEAMTVKELQPRNDGLVYASSGQTPYTGWAKQIGGTAHDFGGFKNGELEFNYDVQPREIIVMLAQFKNGKQDGLQVDWYPYGQKMSEEKWKDGKPEGLFTTWHENGKKWSIETYKNGKLEGNSFGWYPNGAKERETNYKNGKPDGLWTSWYGNGQKASEVSWKDGKKDGTELSWHENGEKRSEGNYKGFIKTGKYDLTWWYENGREMALEKYKDNKLISVEVWKPNGDKCPVTNFKGGNGVVVQYKSDGTEEGRKTYKDGEIVKTNPLTTPDP